jgi:hypothetical protein
MDTSELLFALQKISSNGNPSGIFVVYDGTEEYQSAIQTIEKFVSEQGMTIQMNKADEILPQEIYDSPTPQATVRVITDFEKVPFLNPIYLSKLAPKSAIHKEAKKSKKPRQADNQADNFLELLKVIDRVFYGMLIQKIAIPNNILQRLSNCPIKHDEVRHSYTKGSKIAFIDHRVGSQKLAMVAMAYKYLECLIPSCRPTHTTAILIDEATFAFLRRFNADNGYSLQDCPVVEMSQTYIRMPKSVDLSEFLAFIKP